MAVLKPEENKEEIKSVEQIFPKVMRTNEIKNEINDIKIWESKIKEKYLKYEKKIKFMVFSNMIQENLLVIVFILVTLIEMKEI